MSPLTDKFRSFFDSRPASFLLGVRLAAFDSIAFVAAVTGLAVGVLVMFVEIGFLLAILQAQARIATLVRGDLVVMSAARTSLHDWRRFDRVRLAQALGYTRVEQAIPIYESGMLLRNPPARSVHRVIAFAFPADTMPLDIGNRTKVRHALQKPNAILFDRLSRPLFGPISTGRKIELDGKAFDVAGKVDFGPDMIMDGAVFMSEGTWLSSDPGAQPILGVIRLKPGTNVNVAERKLRALLPDDVTVMTPRDAYDREINFTLRTAPIGFIFALGAAAGLVIGAIICYQTLYNQIIDCAKEYATLRVMGFSNAFFRRVMIEQGVLLALSSLVVGAVGAMAAYWLLGDATGMRITLGIYILLVVGVPTLGVSAFAADRACRHILNPDPAELY
ncbi:MAG: ABC transporter permease [Alphaproteobacteria bacterium]|nr:ABC transporter permease [Alphaproteobacteria bacterium]